MWTDTLASRYEASFGSWNKGDWFCPPGFTDLEGTANFNFAVYIKACSFVASVDALVMETCYIKTSTRPPPGHKVFNTVECIDWDVVPTGGELGVGSPINPPTVLCCGSRVCSPVRAWWGWCLVGMMLGGDGAWWAWFSAACRMRD